MNRKRYVSASEISDFRFCEEQHRLRKLERNGLITVDDEENLFLDARMEEGTANHQQYRHQRKKSSGCTTGCLIVALCLIVYPVILYLLSLLLN